MNKKNRATALAITAAAAYSISIPLSKILLRHVDTTMMASLLYLGAGVGLLLYSGIESFLGIKHQREPLKKKELPYTIAMVVLDIIAPILLMLGLARTNSANATLLNNFEIVATSVIAMVIFKEMISKRLWIAIVLVIIASVILTFEGAGALSFNQGSLFVLGASICWGLENNCTNMISNKNPIEIVIIKGIFSGLGSFAIAIILRESIPALPWALSAMVLGFLSYGISVSTYIMAQKDLGAAKTSAYYSVAPFLGVAFSMLLLGERPELKFYIAFAIIGISTFLMIKDSIELQHNHDHNHLHDHIHQHEEIIHQHEHAHSHSHLHIHEGEEEHTHSHSDKDHEEHVHSH